MRCNLNFNQCNFRPYFPRPIFTCCSNLARAISNNSPNQVINPPLQTITFSIFASSTSQNVVSGASVITNLIISNESDVIVDEGGKFIFQPGIYRVSYSATGIIPSSGTFSLALNMNGTNITESTGSVTGNVGNIVNINGSAVVSISSTADSVRLVNNVLFDETISSVNLSFIKIGM